MDKYRIEKKFLINNHDKNFIHNLIKINTFFLRKNTETDILIISTLMILIFQAIPTIYLELVKEKKLEFAGMVIY